MKFCKILLKNPRSGLVKKVPAGFSWTVLLFGFFVPLSRRDWFWAFLMFMLTLPTFGLSSIIIAFTYNNGYICRLLTKGFRIYMVSGNLSAKSFDRFSALQDRVFNKAFPKIYDYCGEVCSACRPAA